MKMSLWYRSRRCFRQRLVPVLIVTVATVVPLRAERIARNVILMIPDGCSSEQYTLTRWYRGSLPGTDRREELALDRIRRGAVQTYISDSVIADSAPMASAYATGMRTSDKRISVGPHGRTLQGHEIKDRALLHRPLATVLEGARLLGMATGLVVTSSLSHATPAGFVSHVPSRKQDEDIMEQAVYQNCNILFGGGRQYLLPVAVPGGKRTDGENLIGILEDRGYTVLSTWPHDWTDLPAANTGSAPRIAAFLADDALAPELDRPEVAPGQPTLLEMTRQAIALLSTSPTGFFLMVEGSQVDWACHANDAAYMVNELLMFDRAVEAALEFARQDGETLLIVCSDHNTGGMSIGNMRSSNTYSQTSVEALTTPLLKMTCTAETVWSHASEPGTIDHLKTRLGRLGACFSEKDLFGFSLWQEVNDRWAISLSTKETSEILALAETYPKGYYALAEVVSRGHTLIGWTSHGHTGGDVPLYAYGPGAPAGLLDAPEVAGTMAAALGIDLRRLDNRLFAAVSDVFPPDACIVLGYDRNQDRTVEERVLHITWADQTAELPVNTNLLRMNGRTIPLEGIVVYVPDLDQTFVPLQAAFIIQGRNDALPDFAADRP